MRGLRLRSCGLVLVVAGASVLTPASGVLASSPAPEPAGPTSTAPDTAGPDPSESRAADGELVGMRTRFSRTYPSADGSSFATRVFDVPVNYRDADGAWQRIEPALRPDRAGFRNAAADFDVQVPGAATGEFGVGHDSRSVRFVLQGASADSVAQVDGAVARYLAARPGVDVELESTASGLKETLVLTGPESPAASTFDVLLSPGLTVRQTEQGGLEVVEAGSGRVRFVVPPPFALDGGEPAAYTDAVRFVLGGTAAAPTVTLAVDEGWLADPARVFPVRVDPTTTALTSPDATYIDSGSPSTNYHTAAGTTLKAGGPYRSLFHFDVAAALPSDITPLTSDVRLWVTANSASSTALSMHPLTSSFSGPAATWNQRLSGTNWATAGGDVGPAVRTHAVDTVLDEWGWAVSGLVRGWLDTPTSNHGLLLQAADGSGGVVEFAGRDTGWPYLNVHWVPRAGLRSIYTYDEQDLSDTSRLAVNVATGNLTYTAQDLSLTGPQLSLNVTRPTTAWLRRPTTADIRCRTGGACRLAGTCRSTPTPTGRCSPARPETRSGLPGPAGAASTASTPALPGPTPR
jgi:hypothetical protein